MQLGAEVAAPSGFLAYCQRTPGDCPQSAGAGTQHAVIRRNAVTTAAIAPPSLWQAAFAAARAARAVPVSDVEVVPVAAQSPELALTRETRQLLRVVNDDVNGRIVSRTDMETRGVGDYWSTPLTDGEAPFGDCEDYVLEKRRALVAAGIAPEALSIAVVVNAANQHHAVLLVATDRGELVLDNLSPRIAPWWSTRYAWIQRQVPGDSLRWVQIRG